MSFIVACVIFNFLAYYINGVSVTRLKNNKAKILQKTVRSKKTLDLCQLPKIMIELAFPIYRVDNVVEIE